MKLAELIEQEGKELELAPGEHVFIQGELNPGFYYVKSGLLKAYYVSGEGKEFIKSFIMEGQIIGSVAAAWHQTDTTFGLICLEYTLLVEIPFQTVFKQGRNDLELANELMEHLLHLALKKEKREYEFLCLSAEQRYRSLVENTPSIICRVTQNDLARYLGLTPVGLSRIKKRVSISEF